MVLPSKEKYFQDAELFDIVPVWEEITADLETPISVFMKAAAGDYTFLLESVEGGEHLARFSFMGFDPFLVFSAKGRSVVVEEEGEKRAVTGEPLELLKGIVNSFRVKIIPDQPRFFGGAVGYFGYDLVRHYERLPELALDSLGVPDCCFVFARMVLIYDHVRHSLKIVALIPRRNNAPAAVYEEAVAAIEQVKNRIGMILNQNQDKNHGQKRGDPPGRPSPAVPALSNITREDFIRNVQRAKEYIKAGDIFQVVLSQRFHIQLRAQPFEVYRWLRATNPSPYMFYLNFGHMQIAGSSPEMLIRVENGQAETHPIAGTRPRGASPDVDEKLAEELRADAKERAEHLMLVDLGRNDLGRVCEYGSVRLSRFMEVERYSHVMHLVSTVQGKLSRKHDAYDALRACFPAGTVSGAPKIRAMEIIEELEPERRGPYAGAIGYLGFHGSLDTCITIRTILFQNGAAYIQTGAGIVADSDPEREYEETLNKAKALFNALDRAEEAMEQ